MTPKTETEIRKLAEETFEAILRKEYRIDSIDVIESALRTLIPPQEPVMEATGTEARVCGDIVRRQQIGIAKYGQTVEANPLQLKEWLNHAYEEALDQAIYLKRSIEEIAATQFALSIQNKEGVCDALETIKKVCERPSPDHCFDFTCWRLSNKPERLYD